MLERLTAPRPHRTPPPACALPGRPGLLAREVALQPHRWRWLNRQPGGVAAVLRQLVDQARSTAQQHDDAHSAREAAYRALQALASDTTGFEQACCALFAGDRDAFAQRTACWPEDVAAYGLRLAEAGWSAGCTCATACEPRPGP